MEHRRVGYQSSHACPGARARRRSVSSEGWSWINSTVLPGTTLACTALMASSGSPVATIQISNVRPPVDADRAASTRTKNASAILLMWDELRLAANSAGHIAWSYLRLNAARRWFCPSVRQMSDERPPSNCPAIRDADAKLDGMIDGQEGGPAHGHICGAWSSRAIYHSKIAAT